jgi:CDP-diacylglycerol---serine O-phosphatidyltransferase
MIASFPIAMHGLRDWALDPNAAGTHVAEWLIAAVNVLVPLITLAVACLMVSRLRYAHVFNQLFRGQKSRQHVIQIVFSLAAVFLVQEMALPLIFGYFAFSAPARAFWTEVVGRRFYKSSTA